MRTVTRTGLRTGSAAAVRRSKGTAAAPSRSETGAASPPPTAAANAASQSAASWVDPPGRWGLRASARAAARTSERTDGCSRSRIAPGTSPVTSRCWPIASTARGGRSPTWSARSTAAPIASAASTSSGSERWRPRTMANRPSPSTSMPSSRVAPGASAQVRISSGVCPGQARAARISRLCTDRVRSAVTRSRSRSRSARAAWSRATVARSASGCPSVGDVTTPGRAATRRRSPRRRAGGGRGARCTAPGAGARCRGRRPR